MVVGNITLKTSKKKTTCCRERISLRQTASFYVLGMTLSCIHIFIVTGSFLYWWVMRSASQRFFIHSCIYLWIVIISYLATFLGTNSLSMLMCCCKAVTQSLVWASVRQITSIHSVFARVQEKRQEVRKEWSDLSAWIGWRIVKKLGKCVRLADIIKFAKLHRYIITRLRSCEMLNFPCCHREPRPSLTLCNTLTRSGWYT